MRAPAGLPCGVWLLLAAAMPRPTTGVIAHLPSSALLRPILWGNRKPWLSVLTGRTRTLVAQEGWITGVDESGQAYYYRELTSEFQYDPPQAVQQHYGGRVLLQVVGRSGVHCWCNYALKNGDVQALSRFAMLEQKVTVSRVQCIVQVHDGVAALTSCGRGPTLWRPCGHSWVALGKGDQVPLNDGDELSLDCNDPEGAVFVCQDMSSSAVHPDTQRLQDEVAMRQGEQGGDAQGQPLLPYPWEQLVDENGALYYSNPQTGELSWNPPQPGGYPQQDQQQYGQTFDQQQYGQQQEGYPQHDGYLQQGGSPQQGGYPGAL